MRIPLELVDQNRWRIEREGAWLKQTCAGDRVDLERVDRMSLTVFRKSDAPARFCITPFAASVSEPEPLDGPVLPHGPLLDGLGQSTLHDWPAKSASVAEVSERLRGQLDAAPGHRWPDGFTSWGGWSEGRFEATGRFRTHHDGRRWWLVDPDGRPFWSAGLDCVGPNVETAYGGLDAAIVPPADPEVIRIATSGSSERPAINYLAANLVGAFGPAEWRERWGTIALAELRRLGFNTVGNWSDWRVAARGRFPYVRPLNLAFPTTPLIYRDFPDVWHPGFADDVTAFASGLAETAGDPAMIGYFLGNEPNWGFAAESPAAGMLFVTDGGESRQRFRAFLQDRYADDAGLADAWRMPVDLDQVERGRWTAPLTPEAVRDCETFSELMVRGLFDGLSAACRAVDPDHLNLGARYHTVPPDWAIAGMGSFDVFSVNCYRERVRDEEFGAISARLERPVLVGEWHFGALDVGLPATGIGHVPDQEARGRAYRVYAEDAATRPWCVGVHYFTLYDESALGRFDGENCNIGFLDVCHRPYEPLARAARATHERLYGVASGALAPFDDAPEYRTPLFN